jgi:hypothetical protein
MAFVFYRRAKFIARYGRGSRTTFKPAGRLRRKGREHPKKKLICENTEVAVTGCRATCCTVLVENARFVDNRTAGAVALRTKMMIQSFAHL